MRKSIILIWLTFNLLQSNILAQDFQFSQLDHYLQLYHPTASVLKSGSRHLQLAYRSERLPQSTLRNLFLSYNHRVNDFTFGLIAAQNTAGPSSLESMRLGLQANYQRVLNANKDALSAGVRIGVLQRRFNGENFQFDRQYVSGQGWDAGLESGESFAQGSIRVPVLDAGLLFRKYFNRFETNFGVSLNTINQPEMELVDGMAMSYPMQLSLFTKIRLQWSDQWQGDFYWSHNRLLNFRETQAGILVKYALNEQSQLILGLANRFGDALILQAGMTWKGLQIITSYDFGHQHIPGARGILELGLSYQINPEPILSNPRTIR